MTPDYHVGYEHGLAAGVKRGRTEVRANVASLKARLNQAVRERDRLKAELAALRDGAQAAEDVVR